MIQITYRWTRNSSLTLLQLAYSLSPSDGKLLYDVDANWRGELLLASSSTFWRKYLNQTWNEVPRVTPWTGNTIQWLARSSRSWTLTASTLENAYSGFWMMLNGGCEGTTPLLIDFAGLRRYKIHFVGLLSLNQWTFRRLRMHYFISPLILNTCNLCAKKPRP